MKQMWAPWRLEYVRHVDDDDGCFICRALAGDADRENLVLKRGSTCAVIMNRYPYANGHLMICPYRHVDDLVAMNPDERLEAMDLVADSIGALKKAVCPDGFNVGTNLGRIAGAGLKEHVHTHVVPRWSGDTNFMPVLADVKIVPQSLLELWDELHPLLNS
jgi:ATP adenylyltransferase